MSNDRAVQTADHDLLALAQDTVGQDDIDCRPKTLDDLDLQNRTLEFGEVHQPVAHALLRQVDEKHDHVRHTLPGHRGGRDDGDVPSEALVLVVEDGIKTLLSKRDDDLLSHVLELALHSARLLRE